MMYYDLSSLEVIAKPEKNFIALHNHDDLTSLYGYFEETIVNEICEQNSMRYEDHLDFDMVCVWRTLTNGECDENVVHIFICEHSIHFVGEKGELVQFIETVKSTLLKSKRSIGMLLHQFLLHLANDYYLISNQIENEISLLENEVLARLEDNQNYSRQILHYRKQLLLRKRRMEQFLDIIDYLMDNNNDIYNDYELTRFVTLKDRLNRMLSQIVSLLEYVTEVREAFQSAMDRKQNKIMSLFTVVTSIFLPLSLIAGWYGMNFNMPEFASEIAYPIVIVASILVVIICLYYFRKKKWF